MMPQNSLRALEPMVTYQLNPDADWAIRAEKKEFPFGIGEERFLGVVDTGVNVGAAIDLDTFTRLADEGHIHNLRRGNFRDPQQTYSVYRGIADLVLKNYHGVEVVINNMTITGHERIVRHLIGYELIIAFTSIYYQRDGIQYTELSLPSSGVVIQSKPQPSLQVSVQHAANFD